MSSYYFIGQSVSAQNGTFPNPLVGPNGTAAAPTYSFSAHTGDGWYYDTTHSALAASTGGVEAFYFTDTGQNGTFAQSTSSLVWASRVKVSSPSDAFLQIQPNAGGNPTTLLGGVIFGNADATGASLVFSAAGTVRVQTGNQGANGTLQAASYLLTNVDGTLRVGSTTAGLAPAGTGALSLVANSALCATWNTSQQFSFYKRAPLTKTSTYIVLAGDSGSFFNTIGAGATIQFTLPTAAVGLTYTFYNATGAGVKLQAAAGDVIQMAAAASSAGGTATTTTTGASMILTCMAANLWVNDAASGGVWTLA